jgi:hypothetical protein
MSRIQAPVMLVGSIPLASAEEVLATSTDEVGGLVAALPDGETGYRTNWINYQAYFVHHAHPDIETMQRPAAVAGVEQWSPHGFEDLWSFRLKPGVEELSYPTLYYAEDAARSYLAFRDLRDAGRIPDGVRFQVSLPTPTGVVMTFFRDRPDDYPRVHSAYEEAMRREVDRILSAVPAEDLAIQWDVCPEVIDNDGPRPWLATDTTPWERYTQTIDSVGSMVPEDVLLGYHLCYGDLGGHHIVEPEDLALVTRMANYAVSGTPRPVDWLHMPVPIGRDDDAYFEPLAQLEAPDARLFLGLIHDQDGVDGASRRAQTAQRHAPSSFGFATECGFGRRPTEAVAPLLRLHREVAEKLSVLSDQGSRHV